MTIYHANLEEHAALVAERDELRAELAACHAYLDAMPMNPGSDLLARINELAAECSYWHDKWFKACQQGW